MIKKVKVLATEESTLDALLPKGHEIETDSPHVLVVGPNGSGKTAFHGILKRGLITPNSGPRCTGIMLGNLTKQ